MLTFSDSGSGMDPAPSNRRFEAFRTTKAQGSGLGLAIVNHILSEHGARVRVEDNRPSGARFYVDVPVAVAAEALTSGVRTTTP